MKIDKKEESDYMAQLVKMTAKAEQLPLVVGTKPALGFSQCAARWAQN